MKKRNKSKIKFTPLLLILSLVMMLGLPTISFAAQPTVDLGTTTTFAVLAGSTITNTGTTIINGDAGGDVGVYPGTVFTGMNSTTIDGTVHLGDATALQAKNDLAKAFDDAASRTPVTRIPTELGGTTLTPGVYDSADGTFQVTGTLTLDAQGDPNGVFVFKTASTLITATDSNVVLINSARYCRTFWQVGSSATLGTNSHLAGHIFALTSITANTGASMQGQLLARNGAVTLDGNTITNGVCVETVPPVIPTTATLNVIKHVINNNGGTNLAPEFMLHIKSSGIDVVGSPSIGSESPGTTFTLPAGNYQITEVPFPGYALTYSGDGDATGNITLALGDNKTIILNNDDIAPVQVDTPIIHITKTPSTTALTNGKGMVTYTYQVTNPGPVTLSDITVVDNKISLIKYISGDINADKMLQKTETWIYKASATITKTTTNTATAQGHANGMIAEDLSFATVVVTTPEVIIDAGGTPTGSPTVPAGSTTTTINGGQLPRTSTPLYNVLMLGMALTVVGAIGWKLKK